MTYPGTVNKSLLEIMEDAAGQGNPLAVAFLLKKRTGSIEGEKVDPVKRYIAEHGLPYLPEVQEEIADFDPNVDDGIPF